jgi:hypothetical protein
LLEALGSALIGAVVGTLVAELRIYFQGRREWRRILSRVLFNQLEVLHGLWRRNPQVLFDGVIVYLAQRYQVQAEELRANLTKYVDIRSILRELLAEDQDPNLGDQYEAVVADLAAVEPVLAYRLRGRPKLAALEGFWHRYVDALRERALLDEDSQILARVSDTTSSRLHAEALETLKGDASGVARLLGRRRRHEVASAIRHLDEAVDIEVSQFMDRLFDDVEPLLPTPPDTGNEKT